MPNRNKTLYGEPITVLTMEWRRLRQIKQLGIDNRTLQVAMVVEDFDSQSHSTCSSVGQMYGTTAHAEATAAWHLCWQLESSVCQQIARNWQRATAETVMGWLDQLGWLAQLPASMTSGPRAGNSQNEQESRMTFQRGVSSARRSTVRDVTWPLYVISKTHAKPTLKSWT